jgi:hypothetical protein
MLPPGVLIGEDTCQGCETSGPCAFLGTDGIILCAECLTTKVLPPLNAYVTPTEPDFEIKS